MYVRFFLLIKLDYICDIYLRKSTFDLKLYTGAPEN